MATKENIKFSFTSTSQPEDTFTVAEFEGSEAISRLYEFDITLYADDPDIDLKEVLKNPVKLTVEQDGENLRVFHGILSRFEQLHEYSGHVYFRAILVPRLWIADQYLENQLFLDKSVPDIVEEILKQAGLTANDYKLKLKGKYPNWEYICQYNETDFNFISRWMEHEGIYYYFEQGKDAEKLIIADASTAHEDITSRESIRYSPPDSLSPSTTEQVREFTCHQQLLPQKVILKDYNYRKPSLALKGEADVDPEGRGNVYIYGEHFKTPEAGNALAKIRAEELLCREALFFGEGTVPPFLTGYIFEMHDHYRDSYNQRYLITELSHHGVQSTYVSGAGGADPDTEKQRPAYFNNFSCIPADTQFRPERLAVKPRLKGTLNGHVDAGGDGKYAEIDDEGRYKIKLPFDQSDAADGKASRWVRMSQPYAGADYGMHFPLHKGTEVLLTFIDGDPDRPIISGTVPNPETGSPVTGGNQTQSMIRTAGGNQIRIEDSAGGQQIHMSSPTEGSIISLGAPNEGNIYHKTDGNWVAKVGTDLKTTIGGNETHTVTKNRTVNVTGKEDKKVKGDSWCKYDGAKAKLTAGLTEDIFIGAKLAQNLSASTDITVGLKHGTFVGMELAINKSSKIEKVLASKLSKITAQKKEETGSYEMEAFTSIDLKGGTDITIDSGSKVIVKAPEIELIGKIKLSGDVTITGELTVKKNVFMEQALDVKKHAFAKNFTAD